MEKLVYALGDAQISDPAAMAQELRKAGASRIRINLRDEAVGPAEGLAQQRSETLPNAVVQCWLNSSNELFRTNVDEAIGRFCQSHHAWLVSESTVITNNAHPSVAGQRTYGFAQIAFLTLPNDQDWADWRAIWRDSHTQIAIDTQSNFEYVQNLIIEPLDESAPPFVAIVEECFPPAAMSDPMAFFDAVGDQQRFDANLKLMMDSCARFITPGTIDVVPTSQFDFTHI